MNVINHVCAADVYFEVRNKHKSDADPLATDVRGRCNDPNH